MTDFMKDMMRDIANVAADLRSEKCDITLADGTALEARAILVPESEEVFTNEFGVSQSMPWPRIDILKCDLEAAGISEDFETALYHASITCGGKAYTLDDIRADRIDVIKARLSTPWT